MTLEKPHRPDAANSAAATASRPAAEEPHIYVASQWQLIWWKFRKHKLALISAGVVALIYLIAVLVEPIAPYMPDEYSSGFTYAPPQALHLFHEGQFVGPFVYGLKQVIEPVALRRIFTIDPETRIPVGLFVHGPQYKLWGLIESDIHLIGPVEKGQRVFFLGGDKVGRDVFSRIIYGSRISMSIGLVGVVFSLIFGITLGGISGYFGGAVDNVIQRIIEFLRSIPTIPLWMGLAAAVPSDWPSDRIYFSITIILSVIGWTGLARVVRGRFPVSARRGFCHGCAVGWRERNPHYPVAHGAVVRQPYYRRDHPGDPDHDPGRNCAQLPRSGLTAAGGELGRAASGSPEHSRHFIRPLAAAAGSRGDDHHPVPNFLGDGLRDAADPYGR